MKRNKQIDIKGTVAIASTFHFLYSCARSCIFPFLTLYFRHLGLTPSMTGLLMGTKHLISLVWSPLASFLSKQKNKRRAAITGSLICSAGAALVLLLIPSTGVETQTSHCNISHSSVSLTEGLSEYEHALGSVMPTTSVRATTVSVAQMSSLSEITPESAAVLVNQSITYTLKQQPPNKDISEWSHMNASLARSSEGGVNNGSQHSGSDISHPIRMVRSLKSGEEEKQQRREKDQAHSEFLGGLKVMDVQHQLFFMLLILVSLWELFDAPLEWTVDDGLYEYLDFVDASDRYGSTGVWGLLGAACGVGGAGLLVGHLDCFIASHTPRSNVHFYSYAVLTILALPVAAFLPLYLNKKRDRSTGLIKALHLVQGNPRALLCAATAFLVGVAGSAVDDFLLWQMQDNMSSEVHMGISLALALLSRAAFPLLSGHVSKLLSPGRVLLGGTAWLALQCLYYSFLWGPWAALPAQVLSCFSMGAYWWAVQVQCEDVATPGTERSVSRIYQSLSMDLGAGLGSLAGGFIVHRFGVSVLFRGVAVLLLLWCMFLPLLQLKAPRQRRINYSRLLAADTSEGSESESDQERDWLEKAMDDEKGNNNTGRRINP
ncbi:major facilitator superfamily domain-containing protein 6-like [Esox lucius]|uniref:Major facilitator superfamily associated domain-containing protein n=1 Tax=Esox lucius TaxID=8010 RepID=A0AAY5K956_ESOLU|nr:major facilitator superfamily domain-containing protein 6-like [Esox lucius]XP_019906794.1 major facilitator superfamily domain-containing protein 6-like [Esox lucius]XP_019906795.1 major facilitator superfamily domain-containing protein 6-like [Esox lucius]